MERFAQEGTLTRLLVSRITKRHSTGDQWFQAVIVIVLGFQVAVVNRSEKPSNLIQGTAKMEIIGSVLAGRVECMRTRAVQGVEADVPLREYSLE